MNDKKMLQLINDERGTGLFEYALLVALIAVVSIAGISFVGGRTKGTFVNASKGLASSNIPTAPRPPGFPGS